MKHSKPWMRLLVAGLALQIIALPAALGQINFTSAKLSPDAQRALNSNQDVLGQEVLAEGDPSFKSVSRFFPAMRRPRAIVGVPAHPDFIGILWDGTLEIGSARIRFVLGNPPSPYGFDGPVTRSLLGGYLPVVQTKWQFRGLLYEESVLGYSKDMSTSEPLSAFVRVQVTNPGSTPRTAYLSAYSAPALGGPVPHFQATIAPGKTHDFYFRIPYKINPQQLVIPITEADYQQVLDKTKAFWTTLLNEHMEITTPEKRVNDAYRAWLMYNFLNVHKIDGHYQIHDGSGFYDQVYGYSAALYTDALARYGYSKDAEKYLDDMLLHQRPNGLYETQFGATDNGALLFALAQEYEFNHDSAWFKAVEPKMIRSCEWIQSERAKTEHLKNGVRPITYGLLPPMTSYNDYQPPVQSYLTDSYNWLGMYEAALAFRAAGATAEADKWLKASDDYRSDILASMQKSLVNVGGFEALPVEPLTDRLLKQGGGNYYGLMAPEILETKIFGAHDDRTQWITRYMEDRGGLLLGLDRFGDGTDSAYTYGYALTQLREGNVKKFLLTFYSTLAYGMSRGTYASVEINHLIYGLNEMTLPHTYSGTQELRMLRLMLVRREGNDILLASGTPRAWLQPGKSISVKNTPTFYGKLSYTITAGRDGHGIRAVIQPVQPSFGAPPSHVEIWLRGPHGNPQPGSVKVNGKSWTSFKNGAIILPGTMLNQKIEIESE